MAYVQCWTVFSDDINRYMLKAFNNTNQNALCPAGMLRVAVTSQIRGFLETSGVVLPTGRKQSDNMTCTLIYETALCPLTRLDVCTNQGESVQMIPW